MSSEPSIFFSDVNERQGSFLRRTFVLGGLTTLGGLALTGRLAQLQVIQAGQYATMASNNQFNFRLVPPPRGRILDRDGVVIAGNRPRFRVLVVRDETKDLDQTLDLLGRLLVYDPARRLTAEEALRHPLFRAAEAAASEREADLEMRRACVRSTASWGYFWLRRDRLHNRPA